MINQKQEVYESVKHVGTFLKFLDEAGPGFRRELEEEISSFNRENEEIRQARPSLAEQVVDVLSIGQILYHFNRIKHYVDNSESPTLYRE